MCRCSNPWWSIGNAAEAVDQRAQRQLPRFLANKQPARATIRTGPHSSQSDMFQDMFIGDMQAGRPISSERIWQSQKGRRGKISSSLPNRWIRMITPKAPHDPGQKQFTSIRLCHVNTVTQPTT
jgi:hypothetical protein